MWGGREGGGREKEEGRSLPLVGCGLSRSSPFLVEGSPCPFLGCGLPSPSWLRRLPSLLGLAVSLSLLGWAVSPLLPPFLIAPTSPPAGWWLPCLFRVSPLPCWSGSDPGSCKVAGHPSAFWLGGLSSPLLVGRSPFTFWVGGLSSPFSVGGSFLSILLCGSLIPSLARHALRYERLRLLLHLLCVLGGCDRVLLCAGRSPCDCDGVLPPS